MIGNRLKGDYMIDKIILSCHTCENEIIKYKFSNLYETYNFISKLKTDPMYLYYKLHQNDELIDEGELEELTNV